MSVSFNQGGDTLEVGISVDMVGVEQTITIPGSDANLMVSNISSRTLFLADTTGKDKLGLPVVADYVVVTANPGTLYLTAYGVGTVYITPGSNI